MIEILVVLAIIGLLTTIVLVSVNDVRKKGRDAKRIQDLRQIGTALALYYDIKNNWIETGSGCGAGGNGSGWFNYIYFGYKATAQCLIDEGALTQEIIDPTGGRLGSTPTNNVYTYMKYNCGTPTRVYVYAKLETKPQSPIATDGTCCSICDSAYGMNYYLQVQ